MVDLAGVIEVMLDHHRDDPARLLALTPVRQPWAQQLSVIVEGGNTLAQALWPARSHAIADTLLSSVSTPSRTPSTRGSSQVSVAPPKA